ncbi:MAG: ABC transporter substrate-binding protein [Acidobacteria bacterium]|nr:ABC transporter substrate-binding protein [Acidobacteriota bacterium]
MLSGGAKLRRVMFFLAAVTTSLLLAACASPGPDEHDAGGAAEDHGRGTAVLGLTADLDALNPYLSVRASTRDVAYNIYASLMEEQADFQDGPPSFNPDLAQSWEQSKDNLAITFHLRPEAVWSDGTPITAEDVRFTQEAAVHPDVAWLAADVKKEITHVEVLDSHTVRFTFSRPYPYQLMDANDGVILPSHVWSRIPFSRWRSDGPRVPDVVSGPFRMRRWTAGQSIELEANPRYYDPRRPGLGHVAFRILPDAVSGFEQFLAGHLDFWDRVDPRQMDRVLQTTGVALRRYPDRYYGFIGWNCRRRPFTDPRVRRALTLAMDRERIVRDIFRGVARVASGPVPPVFGTRLSGRPPLPHDPPQAMALLDAAGWPAGGANGLRHAGERTLSFELQVNADAPWRRDMALMIQEDLRRIGVEVTIVSLERGTYGASHRTGEFDAYIGGWRLPTKIDLATTFSTRAVEDGVNFGGYSNPALDELLARIAGAPDFTSSLPALEHALDILQEDRPYTFLYWQDRLVGVSTRIKGAQPNAQSALFRLADWSLTGGEAAP